MLGTYFHIIRHFLAFFKKRRLPALQNALPFHATSCAQAASPCKACNRSGEHQKKALQVLIEQDRQSLYPTLLHKFKNHAS